MSFCVKCKAEGSKAHTNTANSIISLKTISVILMVALEKKSGEVSIHHPLLT